MAETTAAKKAAGATKKTECPVTKNEFQTNAKPVAVRVGDETKVAGLKEFSSGSLGWYTNEKVTIMVGDVPVRCQAAITITVIGSKPEGSKKK